MKSVDETGGRKPRAKDKLSEPLRIRSDIDSNDKPIWRIVGWTIEGDRSGRVNKQCPRKDGDRGESYRNACNIKYEIEMERDRRRGTSAPMVKRFTSLTDTELRTYEGIQRTLERNNRSDPLNVFDCGLANIHDNINSPILASVCGAYVNDRKHAFEIGDIRIGDKTNAEHYADALGAMFPNITLHQFVTDLVVEPLPPPPPISRHACAAAFGVRLHLVLSWMNRDGEEAAAWPTLVYQDGEWVWGAKKSAAFADWIRHHGREPCVPCQPHVATPPHPNMLPRSRIELFCERPILKSKNGKLPGAMPDLRSMQVRRERVMHMLQFAVNQRWLDKLPVVKTYMSHDDRPAGEAPTLSPEQVTTYLRTVEDAHPEFACRESLKFFPFIRPQGESARLEAWINPATAALLPKLAGKKKRMPSPDAITLWPEFRTKRVRGAEILAAGVIYVDATVSKVNFPRRVYIPPNGALWIAIYGPQWENGAWRPEVHKSPLSSFDDLADAFYEPVELPYDTRAELRHRLPLAHDVARHSGVSNFCALHEQNLDAAAVQAGNSVQEIKASYYDVCEYEDAVVYFRILPKGWSWSKSGRAFVPPLDWLPPRDWILPIEREA